MKVKYSLLFSILLINFVCLFFLYLFLVKPSNDKNKYLYYNSNLWYEISLSKNKNLESVAINDYKGRAIFIYFSELGVASFSIIDDKSNYKIENIFYSNFTNEMYINKNRYDNMLSLEEQKIIYRNERYNNIEKEYNVNYALFPYIFFIDNE